MEDLVIQLHRFFENKKVLITGHSGFKGSWMSCILERFNCELYGVSLPEDDNDFHFKLVQPKIKSYFFDILDLNKLRDVFDEIKPHVVLHLASQPIVLESFRKPLLTFQTNVIGTVNLLECIRQFECVTNALIVTSDKCYFNDDHIRSIFTEEDKLGGHDPYSASKACQEIVAFSYANSFLNTRLKMSTVRAGNIIGGGDMANNRLIPDIIRSLKGDKLVIRNPFHVRPWQHVLDALSAYLHILIKQDDFDDFHSFNVSTNLEARTVNDVLEIAKSYFEALELIVAGSLQKNEKKNILLDNKKVAKMTGWRPLFNFEQSLSKTFFWYRENENNNVVTRGQISEYFSF